MITVMYLLLPIAALAAVLLLLWTVVARYLKLRGARVVTCPETKKPAAVEVDARHAAISEVLGETELRLKDCSRWPERQGCGQDCLMQIEESPEGCLVRSIVTQWYEGKACAYCGQSFGKIHWHDHKPALMDAERRTVEWTEVHSEMIPEVLSTHLPVCWNCHNTESFRSEHPELVVDRNRTTEVHVAQG